MSGTPVDLGEGIGRYRALRQQLEEGILPLATSVDGRRFSYQASLHGLELQAGSYVVLEQGAEPRLGQVVTLEVGRPQRPELAAGPTPARQRSAARSSSGAPRARAVC